MQVNNVNISSFKQLLRNSIKSKDTEEWIDIWFTRPIGLIFAIMWIKLGVRPNTITILSIILGVAAGVMFYHTSLMYNVYGVLFLMFANFCDSTDGQMARLTGDKTLIGRMLDGFAGDVWFFSIYLAIALRLWNQPIPFTDMAWSFWGLLLVIVAGIYFHSRQSSLADYYRQIHLFFLKGHEGSELDSSEKQREIYENLPAKGAFWDKIFYYNYTNYCKSQEKRTPKFQEMFRRLNKKYVHLDNVDEHLKIHFLEGSRPLMPITNILTLNVRAIVLYVSCILNEPWIYPLFEMTIMHVLYVYMHNKHERLCSTISKQLYD